MNKRIQDLWVAALRSGEYRQGCHRLKSNDRYCCLGVLCDLHAKETGGKWDGGFYHDSCGVLPEIVRDWAGLVHMSPQTSITCLTHLNDEGALFGEIADEIEEGVS